MAQNRYFFFLAVFSGLLFVVSLGVHISSYIFSLGIAMDSVWYIHLALFIPFGFLVIELATSQNESCPGKKRNQFDRFEEIINHLVKIYKQVPNSLRSVVLIVGVVLFIYVPFNFMAGMVNLGDGGPDYSNGRYYLSNHGEYVRDLTKEEFIQYQAYEVRLFSGHWMILSYLPLIYFGVINRKVER